MREITVDENKALVLDVLSFIHTKCTEDNIHYYLAYGTLLGAVRHGGFIPWDDDVDIFMPYTDYLKFAELMRKDRESRYKLVSYEMDKNFTSPLPKMIDSKTLLVQNYAFIEKVEIGSYVDIFILNGAGNEYDMAVKEADNSLKLADHWIRSASKMFPPNTPKWKGFIRWIKNLPYKLIGIEGYLERFKKKRETHDYYSSVYVIQTSLISSNSPERNTWKREDFGDGVEIIFEGRSFIAPTNYDRLLTLFYGDYMTIPPKEKQITGHNYKVYLKEEE